MLSKALRFVGFLSIVSHSLLIMDLPGCYNLNVVFSYLFISLAVFFSNFRVIAAGAGFSFGLILDWRVVTIIWWIRDHEVETAAGRY